MKRLQDVLRGTTPETHLWYWSFHKFGLEVLSREDAWFFGGLLRCKVVKKVPGGLSLVLREWMEAFLASGADFSTGVSCHTRCGPIMVVAVWKTVLAENSL